MKLAKGTILKAKGGWDAEVIFICQRTKLMLTGVKGFIMPAGRFYAIHQPGTRYESCPVLHCEEGTTHSSRALHEPPVYETGHPADLEMGEYEL